MNLIITIIGTFAAVVAAIYAVRNDKAHIRKCIRKKESKINKLESQIFTKYHNKFYTGISPEQEKIDKLKQEIEDLEDRL